MNNLVTSELLAFSAIGVGFAVALGGMGLIWIGKSRSGLTAMGGGLLVCVGSLLASSLSDLFLGAWL
jgi:hypothetical protein